MLVLAVVGLSYVNLTATKQNGKTCATEDCLRSATSLVESMNRSMDPCENFYEYACGNFGNLHRIPKSAFSNDRFSELHASMLISIRDFMEKEDEDTEPYSVSQSRLLYRSCMATDEMDVAGLKQLFQMLDIIGLPHLGVTFKDTDKKKNFNLSSILASIKKHLNLNYLFMINVEADRKNSTKNLIYLGKPKERNWFSAYKVTDKFGKMSSRKIRETLASEETVNSDNDSEKNEERVKFLKSFAKYFKGVWSELSNSNYTAKLDSESGMKIAQLLMFHNEYSMIREKIYDTEGNVPIVMSVDEFQMYTDNITRNFTKPNEPVIDWKKYLTILFMDVENVTLNFETDLLHIVNIDYFELLFKLLVITNKTQIINNIWWEVITTLLPYTTNQMRFIQDRFYYETTGIENNPSRSIYCASAVNKMMGMAVAYLLVDLKSINRNKNMVVEMIENIHWAFEKIVKELEWMDDTTKERTMHKAQQMKTFVGYPELISDSTQLDDYYSDYEVLENDYFGNVVRFVQMELNSTLVHLRLLNDYSISSWASVPLEVNAYNWIQANAITVPAGILQFPFFGHDLQVLNYGFLGSILGHELTHGFDNTGRKYDLNGNDNMWWTNQTIGEYEKRTDCFIQHYDSYVLPNIGKKISGKSTLDENIADNGGLREALWAYRKFVNDHGDESKLPGLEEFNSEQLYYLAFANNWCEMTTHESQSGRLSDVHSPNYIRVIAALKNSKEFSEVWKCEKGTGMNPKNEKCRIW